MEQEALPPIVSSVPMAPSSIRMSSSVIGGSTLTVQRQKVSTPLMMRMLPRLLLPVLVLQGLLLQLMGLLEEDRPMFPINTISKFPWTFCGKDRAFSQNIYLVKVVLSKVIFIVKSV